MKEANKKITPRAEAITVLVAADMRQHPALLRLKEKLKADLERKDLRAPR